MPLYGRWCGGGHPSPSGWCALPFVESDYWTSCGCPPSVRQIGELLQPGRRQRPEARRMIRTLLSLEGHVADEVEISERDVNRVERGVRDGKSRDEVCAGVSKAGPPAGTATSAPPGEPPCPVGGLPLVAGATTSSGLTGSVRWAPASPPRRCHRRPTDRRGGMRPLDRPVSDARSFAIVDDPLGMAAQTGGKGQDGRLSTVTMRAPAAAVKTDRHLPSVRHLPARARIPCRQA
jgi:hypothetical protein